MTVKDFLKDNILRNGISESIADSCISELESTDKTFNKSENINVDDYPCLLIMYHLYNLSNIVADYRKGIMS